MQQLWPCHLSVTLHVKKSEYSGEKIGTVNALFLFSEVFCAGCNVIFYVPVCEVIANDHPPEKKKKENDTDIYLYFPVQPEDLWSGSHLSMHVNMSSSPAWCLPLSAEQTRAELFDTSLLHTFSLLLSVLTHMLLCTYSTIALYENLWKKFNDDEKLWEIYRYIFSSHWERIIWNNCFKYSAFQRLVKFIT